MAPVPQQGQEDEAQQVRRRPDHREVEGPQSRDPCRGPLPEILREHSQPLKVEGKYGGMDVNEARMLEALEDESARLKKLLADAMLDNSALKVLLEYDMIPPDAE